MLTYSLAQGTVEQILCNPPNTLPAMRIALREYLFSTNRRVVCLRFQGGFIGRPVQTVSKVFYLLSKFVYPKVAKVERGEYEINVNTRRHNCTLIVA